MALAPRAVGSVAGPAVGVVTKGQQGGDVVVGLEPHAAAVASVTAVGTALWHVSLPAERHGTGSTVASAHVQPALVHELRHSISLLWAPGVP
jgi:hypothetical protein